MENNQEHIKMEIENLPKGYISNKKINGKIYHYRQWKEDGDLKSEYISDDRYLIIKEKIERRKGLEKELKEKKYKRKGVQDSTIYEMDVLTGYQLEEIINHVDGLGKRDCFEDIKSYLDGKVTPRICLIYGLRRTGKTTMLHQIIAEMDEERFLKSAYIKARKGQTMSMIDRDLKKLFNNGYKYIFIDEITFLEDFIDTASVLSDIYAAMGMKIVVSGTDSLGLWFASKEELYDRAYTIHTTWIPYAEHSRLLGINDIDEYIRYGGTFRAGETNFDDKAFNDKEISFRDDESTRRYIDTAICGNIQHSLKCYDNGTHFRLLKELYEKNELTSAINRVVEDMNHRFTLKVLTEDFKSSDLMLAKKNVLRERNQKLRTDVLERIDTNAVINRVKNLLEIRNKEEREIDITDDHSYQIKEYLKALELIKDANINYIGTKGDSDTITLFVQPGMRYCQAQVLVNSLQKDEVFSSLNELEKEYVCGKILDDVKGRMLEELVLFETMEELKGHNKKVFKLQFDVGEFDMVIYDGNSHSCQVFEIKHSTEQVKEQCRHLLDENKCSLTEEKYGEIIGKYVLYRGENIEENGIQYLNVSEYLKTLKYGDIDQILSNNRNGFELKM